MRAIPEFDLRGSSPLDHALARPDEIRRLRDACVHPAPGWSLGALRPVDAVAARWLRRTGSPYAREIAAMRTGLGIAGIAAINMSYQFGCTTGIAPRPVGAPIMRRVLDWPFHGLGEAIELHRLSGPAGEYYSLGWTGAAGVLTAMAPGRFCAAINQAPMYRRFRSGMTRPLDLALNLANTLIREKGWPPDHLLRHVFETCADFETAVAMLINAPLARPALFSISGTRPAQSALIERTESAARMLTDAFAVANDWQVADEKWEPRAPVKREARRDNPARVAAMRDANARGRRPLFWLAPPMLNKNTRLAVEMSADGELVAQGFECARGRSHAVPATKVLILERDQRLAA